MKSIFDPKTTEECLSRINALSPETQPQWGKMNVAQMLAHLNFAYDFGYHKRISKNNAFAKFMIKLFVKKMVVSDKPYKKNNRTAPEFIIVDERVFNDEKTKLIDYIIETEKNGVQYFEGRENQSFGKLSSQEWSNLYYKHLDHHLAQFGV